MEKRGIVEGGEERRNRMNDHFDYGKVETFDLSGANELPETRRSEVRKRIALVAHDHKKDDLLEWALFNRGLLVQHNLYATDTTGRMLSQALDTPVTCLKSGPLGGDQQIGGMIADGVLDLLIFFWDSLEQQPHDTDVKALLRIAVVWNIPIACDRATADYVISSPLMTGPYERLLPDYSAHTERFEVEQHEVAVVFERPSE
jgi:methylglyoxal synthase